MAVKNESGSVLEAYDYDPFGKIVKQPLTSAICPFGFQSKYTDRETGLVYFGHRYYDPITNRWINRDPIQEAGGLNLYAMVGNDPVNSADFLGLQSDGDKSSPNTAGENNENDDDQETRCANGEEETVKCGSEDAEVTITTGSGGTVVREYNDGTIHITSGGDGSKLQINLVKNSEGEIVGLTAFRETNGNSSQMDLSNLGQTQSGQGTPGPWESGFVFSQSTPSKNLVEARDDILYEKRIYQTRAISRTDVGGSAGSRALEGLANLSQFATETAVGRQLGIPDKTEYIRGPVPLHFEFVGKFLVDTEIGFGAGLEVGGHPFSNVPILRHFVPQHEIVPYYETRDIFRYEYKYEE